MKRLFFALALCAASGACMAGGDMRFYEARSDKIRFTGRAAENGDGSPVVRLERLSFHVPFRRQSLCDACCGYRA